MITRIWFCLLFAVAPLTGAVADYSLDVVWTNAFGDRFQGKEKGSL